MAWFGVRGLDIWTALCAPALGGEGDQFIFLSREMEILANVEHALDYIETNEPYTGEDYKKLKQWQDLLRGVRWVTDPKLSDGWKRSEDDEEEVSFLGPCGKIFTDRGTLIDYMIKENFILFYFIL